MNKEYIIRRNSNGLWYLYELCGSEEVFYDAYASQNLALHARFKLLKGLIK